MKIRSQFFWMVIGMAGIPILLAGIIALAVYAREPERALVPGYKEISAIATTPIARETWRRLEKYLSNQPSSIDYVVLDRNSTVIYSTVRDFPVRVTLSEGILLKTIRDTSPQYLYQMDAPSKRAGEGIVIVTRILRDGRRKGPWTFIGTTVLACLGALLAFAILMSLLIARSITRSVTILENTTRRIAAGELDLAIDAKGSNEITSLTVSLNRMRLALKDEQSRRSRFIMGVSHDLKTPLALIKGYAEAIADGIADDPEMRQKSLEIIGTKVGQLEGMIDDLIGFVKLDTGEWRRSLEIRELAPTLDAFVRRLCADANLLGKNVKSDIRLDAGVRVAMDERLFIRALENIANNALRYTGDQGIITIVAECERLPPDRVAAGGRSGGEGRASHTDRPGQIRTQARVTVTDDGPGIAAEDLPHIFELFYRGTASRREEGMGLGLSVVKSVADSHGWTVLVASPPGQGTAFTLVMPVADCELLPPP